METEESTSMDDREYRLRQRELDLRERELALQQRQLELGSERGSGQFGFGGGVGSLESLLNQTKKYSDIMKNVMPKMPINPQELPTFFELVENLFDVYHVPDDLKSRLLLAQLTPTAQSLISRLNAIQLSSYELVRDYILNEMKLTPREYRAMFMTATKKPDETYVLFCARLRNLFSYYIKAKGVDTMEKLMDLMVADRLKDVLSPGCLSYCIILEGNTCYSAQALATAADVHDSNYTVDGKYRGVTVVTDNKCKPPMTIKSKVWSDSGPVNRNTGTYSVNNNVRGKPPTFITGKPNPRACWGCGSLSHLRSSCPVVKNTQRTGAINVTDVSDVHDEHDENDVKVEYADTNKCTVEVREPCELIDIFPGNPDDDDDDIEVPITTVTKIDVKKLKYLPIEIKGISGSIKCLNDSGAAFPVIRQDVISHLNLKELGPLKLRSAFGETVVAQLCEIDVRIFKNNENAYFPITVAAVNRLTEQLILPEVVIKELEQYSHYADVCGVEANTDNLDYTDENQNDDTNLKVDNDCEQSMFISDQSKLDKLIDEQKVDSSLQQCWQMASLGKGGYFIKNGALFHREIVEGQQVEQLVVPVGKRKEVVDLAHRTLSGAHSRAKRTRFRIKLHFSWPGLRKDVFKQLSECRECQLKANITRADKVPIVPIVRPTLPFTVAHVDIIGPLEPASSLNHKYCLTIVDACTRYCWVYPLKKVTSQVICDCFADLFQNTGVYQVIVMDNGSNFCSELTKKFLAMLGVSPRFVAPYHPEGNGLVERFNQSFKAALHFAMREFGRGWHKAVPYLVWVLRESPNATTSVSPFMLQYGQHPRGILSLLKNDFIGQDVLPAASMSVSDYLTKLRDILEKVRKFADENAKIAQEQYAKFYNADARDKQFDVDETVIVLERDNTSKTFAEWKTGVITQVLSPYTYIVSMPNGSRRHLHANRLRKFVVQTNHVGLITDNDHDFGDIVPVPTEHAPNILPSYCINKSSLTHLSSTERNALFNVLDQFHTCFSETPGLCNIVQHEINTVPDFAPKQAKAYRIPEILKVEVERQITKLVEMSFVEPSDSCMTSGIVCVTKPDKSVRICCDYRYLNKYTVPDATPMKLIMESVYKISKGKFITVCDAKSGFWQFLVKPEDKWKCSFVTHHGVWTWNRMPFGLKNSPATFVKAVRQVLFPIREHSDAYVDDMFTISSSFQEHLSHLCEFLHAIKSSGLTLNLDKCNFAQNTVKFVGYIVGCGQFKPDPDKVSAVLKLKPPETIAEVRSVLGVLGFYRDHVPLYAEIAKPLTDLTSVKKSPLFKLGEKELLAFDTLKHLVCESPVLASPRFGEPFILHTDASQFIVAGCLSQSNEVGSVHPVAYCSRKLSGSQINWSIVEKEAYAVVWSLNKYHDIIFGAHVTVYTDHDPLRYLLNNTTHSAKLTRWYLAIQQYDVTFEYISSVKNLIADGLTRINTTD